MILNIDDAIDPLEPTNFIGPRTPNREARKLLARDRMYLWLNKGEVEPSIINHLLDNPHSEQSCYFCLRHPNKINVPYMNLDTFFVPVTQSSIVTAGQAWACTGCVDLIKKELDSDNVEHLEFHSWERCSECTDAYTIDAEEGSYRMNTTVRDRQCPSCFNKNARASIANSIYDNRNPTKRLVEKHCHKCSTPFSIDLMLPMGVLLEDYPNPSKCLCSKCRVLQLPPPDNYYVYTYNKDVVITVLLKDGGYYYKITFMEDNTIVKEVSNPEDLKNLADAVCVAFAEVDKRLLLDNFQTKLWSE